MMYRNTIETVVGFMVVVVAAFFLRFAYQNGGAFSINENDYSIKATFEKIDGIEIGSSVKISGITVGKVVKYQLDSENYSAIVTMQILDTVKLPVDTSAEILGSSIIGDKYISLSPGHDDTFLQEGESIEFTQSSISLESLIGKFIFNNDSRDKHAKQPIDNGQSHNTPQEFNDRSFVDEIEALSHAG